MFGHEKFFNLRHQIRTMKFDLEKIVQYPTWREMLINIIVKENIDPWDIDLVKLTSKYIEYIREMKTLELRIPANIILAASILLRMKSEVLKIEEQVQDVETEVFMEPESEVSEIPVLELKTRIPPKRRVTLEELLEALDEAFKRETEKAVRSQRRRTTEIVKAPINIEEEFDIDKLTEEFYDRINNSWDEKGMVTFTSLLTDPKDPEEKVKLFIPLIFEANKGKFVLIQERLFDEIIIIKTDKPNLSDQPKDERTR